MKFERVKTGVDGYKMLEKVGVEALLVEAIKEQQKQIESSKIKDSEQQAQIETQQTINQTQQARIQSLEDELKDLKRTLNID